MAYDYSLTAAYPGETEEERRKRLANQMVGKTEVQTFADGSQTRTTTQEIPAAGPVAPEQVPAPAPAAAPAATIEPAPAAPAAPGAPAADEMEERRRRALAQRPPVPAAAPAPAEPVSPYSLAAGLPPSLGLQVPGVMPGTPAQPPSSSAIDLYQRSQDDPMALLQLRNDQNQPEWIRQRASERAYELLDSEVKKKQTEPMAQQLVQAAAGGDRRASMTIAKELQNQQGSYLKMILLGFLSPELAGEEAVKLGFGNKWQTVYDAAGNPALVQTNARGLPLKGYKADGSAMLDEELISYAGGKRDLDIVGGSYVNDKTGEVGRLVTDKKTGQSYIQTDTGRKPMTGFRPQASTGTLADMRVRAIQDLNIKLQGRTAEEQMQILRPYNQMLVQNGYAPIQPSELMLQAPQIAGAPPAPTAITPGAPGAAPGAPAVGARPGAPGAPGVAARPAGRPSGPALEAGAAAMKAEGEAFIKYDSEDIGPKAAAGSSISSIRKQQIQGPDGILNNPEIAGLLQGQGGAATEVGNIIRDLVTGNFKDEADLNRRVAALNLNQRQKDVLYRQIGLNLQVAPLTLKQNAGPGAVSDAEQKANREANVDITRNPLYSGLSLLTRDQFEKDLQVARGDFRNARPDLNTRSKFDAAWNQEKARIQKEYDNIYAARARYIAKYNPNGTNPGAVVDAYKHYPVPEWDSSNRRWRYGTSYAEQAAKKPPLSDFDR